VRRQNSELWRAGDLVCGREINFGFWQMYYVHVHPVLLARPFLYFMSVVLRIVLCFQLALVIAQDFGKVKAKDFIKQQSARQGCRVFVVHAIHSRAVAHCTTFMPCEPLQVSKRIRG
jgi:hypothetical protein